MKILSKGYQKLNSYLKINIYNLKKDNDFVIKEKQINDFLDNIQNINRDEIINYIISLFSYPLDGLSIIFQKDNICESIFYMNNILTTYTYIEKINDIEIIKIQYDKSNLDTRINAEYFNKYPKVILTKLEEIISKFSKLQNISHNNMIYKLSR